MTPLETKELIRQLRTAVVDMEIHKAIQLIEIISYRLDVANELYSILRVMVQEWIEVMGDEHENRTPGDVLEKAKAALVKARGTGVAE